MGTYGRFPVAVVTAFALNACSTAVYQPIPHFAASQRCPGDGSAEMTYDCDLLNDMGLKPGGATRRAGLSRDMVGAFCGDHRPWQHHIDDPRAAEGGSALADAAV